MAGGGVEWAMVGGAKVLVQVQARDSFVFGLVGVHPGVFSWRFGRLMLTGFGGGFGRLVSLVTVGRVREGPIRVSVSIEFARCWSCHPKNWERAGRWVCVLWSIRHRYYHAPHTSLFFEFLIVRPS